MKLAIHHFSNVVRLKSRVLEQALESLGISVLPISQLKEADGVVVFNIHAFVQDVIKEAKLNKKKILSIQEGMFALGWDKTHGGMKKECSAANKNNIMQFVWSKLECDNYVSMGKDWNLLKHFGNPEHDLLQFPINNERIHRIPKQAFVITHIDQYAHPRGGPNEKQMSIMRQQIDNLVNLDKNIFVVRCLHPAQKSGRNEKYGNQRWVVPFKYPIFDILKRSDLVITLSSTEGITAAILNKPMVVYDISKQPERWPFTEHGVAINANNENRLINCVKTAMNNKLQLPKHVNYTSEYHVDGNISNRVAENMIKYFEGKL